MKILSLLYPVLGVIAIVMSLLPFLQKFNTRRHKFFMVGMCLLVSASVPTSHLLGAKFSTFSLIFCTVGWLASATIWFLNLHFSPKR